MESAILAYSLEFLLESIKQKSYNIRSKAVAVYYHSTHFYTRHFGLLAVPDSLWIQSRPP